MYSLKQCVRSCWWALLALAVATQAQARSLPDFTELVKEAAPAVVNISTVQEVERRNPILPGLEGHGMEQLPDIFRHFFGEGFPPQGPRGKEHRQSLGSGFIISRDGYILTNNHVVDGADEVIVRLNDRRELEARVIGTDARSDLALLKIDENNLPVVRLGSSDKLEVGEWVLAIGSPFGFDHSVTAGIVSAKGRSLPNENYVPFIQTDVAINPGNSGGPLFNMKGEVVGINSQIYTRSGGFMGLSFAIPMEVAMNVVEQLKESGRVTRGWLGVMIQEVNRDLAESFGLDKPAGALVAEVMAGSPAAKAGIRAGDIIIEFAGQDIVRSADLPHIVGGMAPGERTKAKVIRNGRTKTLQVTVGSLPDEEMAAVPGTESGALSNNRLGLVVERLPAELKEKWKLEHGVIVSKVQRGPAAEAGVRRGDVITMLGGEQIDSVQTLAQVVEELPEEQAVAMRIVRNGSPLFLPLRIGKR